MIRADAFHRAFDAPFAPAATAAGLRRQGRKGAKWKASVAGHDLQLVLRVNPKVSGLPDWPGEFWPVMSWGGPRHDARDDGTISYYQYTGDADLAAMQEMRRTVIGKAKDSLPAANLQIIATGLELPLTPQNPHVALYYLDEHDARMWGSWFGAHIGEWLRRFSAAPETVDTWCWRVLWREKPQPA